MKKLIILLLLISLFSNGCNQNKTKYYSPRQVIISGIIKNYSSNPDNKQITAKIYEFGSGDVSNFLSNVNNDGTFSIKFPVYIPQTIWVTQYYDFYILVHPGDSIFIEFDASKKDYIEFLKSLKFSGNAAQSNRDLNAYLINTNQNQLEYNISNSNNVSPSIYKAGMDSIRTLMLGNRDIFIKNTRINREVQVWSLYKIKIGHIFYLLDYTVSRQKYDPIKKRVLWDLPIDYYDFIKDIPEINIESLFYPLTGGKFINAYRNLYLFTKVYNKNIENNSSANSDSTMISEITNKNISDLFSQLLLSGHFIEKLNKYNISDYEIYIDTINKYITEPFIKEPLTRKYQKRKDDIENPKLVSTSIESSTNGDGLIEMLKKIFNDNKGKVIYIDCFGTWCSPCMQELPYSKSLIEKYDGRDISFVFLCVTSDKQKYDALISEFELKGQHYFLNKQQSETLYSHLKISGVPYFQIIDKKGNLVQEGSHLRPSSSSTVALIDKLLLD